jgi:hypothetical protein
MRLREQFFKTQKYILNIISNSKDIVEIKGKIAASTGKRDVSFCFNKMYIKDINIAIIDILCCLNIETVKSVKIELTLNFLSGEKVLLSEYIEAKDIDLKPNIEWDAFMEKEIFTKKDKRKLIHLLEEI